MQDNDYINELEELAIRLYRGRANGDATSLQDMKTVVKLISQRNKKVPALFKPREYPTKG